MACVVSGCTGLADSDAVRLCRSLLPALNADGSRINLRQVVEGRRRDAGGVVVAIRYAARPAVGEPVERSVSCTFDASVPAPSRATDIVEVATEVGSIGPARLHVLKRYWFETGLAALGDPEPFATLGRIPEVSRWLAIGLQHFLSALPAIALYALLGAAYALVYGVAGRINLAFGELAVLGGYGAFLGHTFAGWLGASVAVLAAVVLGICTSLMHGGASARLVFIPLVRRPGQHILIATIGLALFASELMRLTQGAGGGWMPTPLSRPIGLVRAGDFVVTLTPMVLLVSVVALAAGAAVLALIERSPFGRAWRASADDPLAASLMGVDPDGVLLRTLLLASLLAGLAGVLTTLYYGGVGHAGGFAIGLKALIGAVIGGIGSVAGGLVGGMLLGLAEAVWSTAFPVEYRDAAIFSGLAAMLILRPDGLMGRNDSSRRV